MNTLRIFGLGIALLGAGPAFATGLATCESGDRATWQATEVLEKQLTEKGWSVRRIKEDGGCYEVYAIDDKGERVEAYFHPVTLEAVPTVKETPWVPVKPADDSSR